MNPASMAGMTGDEDELEPQEAASMLPSGPMPPMAMPPMMAPPVPQTNPFMAMGSGALAASMGSLANPYLQQQQTQQNSMATQENAMLRTMGYMQQQQLAAQAMQQRAVAQQNLEKHRAQIQELKKDEVIVKYAQELLKGDENAQKLGATVLSKQYNKAGIPASPSDAMQYERVLKGDEGEAVRATLLTQLPDIKRLESGLYTKQEIDAAVDHTRSRYPHLPPKLLYDAVAMMGNPAARAVAKIPEIPDPAQVVMDSEVKKIKGFLELHQGLTPRAYHHASEFFRAHTRGPLQGQSGRELYTAMSESDKALKDAAVRFGIEQDLKEQAAKNPNIYTVTKDAMISSGRWGKPGEAAFDEELARATSPLHVVPPGSRVFSRRIGSMVDETPYSPDQLKDVRDRQGNLLPPGTTPSQAVAANGRVIPADAVAAHRAMTEEFKVLREIIARNKNAFPEPTGDDVTDAAKHIWAEQAVSRGGRLVGSVDQRVLDQFAAQMPLKMRALGANSKTMDSNVERAIAQKAFAIQPGRKDTTMAQLTQLEKTLSEGFEAMGLPPLPGVKPSGVKVDLGEKSGPLAPQPTPTPAQPATTPASQFKEGQRLRGEDGKFYRWKNGKAVPE